MHILEKLVLFVRTLKEKKHQVAELLITRGKGFIKKCRRLYKITKNKRGKKQYSITRMLFFVLKLIPIIARKLLINILVGRFIG